MVNTFKGGRGQKAPYETTHLRVPVPLKPKFEKQIEEYKISLVSEEIKVKEEILPTYEEALEIAREIANSKKNAKTSLANLLTRLYSTKTTLQDITR